MKTEFAFVALSLIALFLLSGCVQPSGDNALKEIKFSEGYAAMGKILENNGTSMQALFDVNVQLWDLSSEQFLAVEKDLNGFEAALSGYVVSDGRLALQKFAGIVREFAEISTYSAYQEMHPAVEYAQSTYGDMVFCSDEDFLDYEEYAVSANEIKGMIAELDADIGKFAGEFPEFATEAGLKSLSGDYEKFSREVTFINAIYNSCRLLNESKKM
ncbi:MAG: hypothetical protein HYW05_01585 [Candidatus Diapherotrites archaeon]|nr:hypothetical protein [Candidatus Diapherotrites archaeon]